MVSFEFTGKMGYLLVSQFERDFLDAVRLPQQFVCFAEAQFIQPFLQLQAVLLLKVALKMPQGNITASSEI